MERKTAETVALKALSWLAGNEELLSVFLGATGATTDTLREEAENADFLVAVLGFLTLDDAWVIAFCDAHGLAYSAPMAARAALPGGEVVNWT